MASTKTSEPKARASKPPTPKSSGSRSRESVDDQRRKSELKPEPLIPKCNRYSHKTSSSSSTAYSLLGGILPRTARRSIGDTMPDHDQEGICKLVHVMANAALFRERKVLRVDKSWEREFDHALVHYLPVREHHVAFLTHNMFVTMIGAVVARALEQATRGKALNKLGTGANDSELREHILDLLADRRYVRNIACHDCSKTSEVEDVAYSGIMAVNMTRAYLEESFDRRCRLSGTSTGSRTDASYQDHAAMTTPMANIGFKHHYENNPHHPEHFTASGKRMPDVYVVEAVVDGLACVFERVKPPHVKAWLGMFSKDRFPDPQNKDLAQRVLEALRDYITDADYTALEAFRTSVLAIAGESCPWARVSMTSCCDHKPLEGDSYSKTNIFAYFEDLGESY